MGRSPTYRGYIWAFGPVIQKGGGSWRRHHRPGRRRTRDGFDLVTARVARCIPLTRDNREIVPLSDTLPNGVGEKSGIRSAPQVGVGRALNAAMVATPEPL